MNEKEGSQHFMSSYCVPASPSLLLTPQGVGLTDEKTDKEIAQDLLGREAG